MTQQSASLTPPLRRTPLFERHVAAGARMVEFAGWEMPIQYEGILAEARAVRSSAGIFDVSHMGRFEITGADAAAFLSRVLTREVAGMRNQRARYTLICNQAGGIIDDTIVYRRGVEQFLLVPNAANASEVLGWLVRWREEWGQDVEFNVVTRETALIALQGPNAEAILQPNCAVDLSNFPAFRSVEAPVFGVQAVVGRTGYTGEDGFEMVLPAEAAPDVWNRLADAGATPCGLGARDVLRLEAGLLLHGSDMDATVTPLEAGLDRFVSWDTGEFIGLAAMQQMQGAGLSRVLVGFHLLERGIPRHGNDILDGETVVGSVTSGTHSPTLDMGIGLGYVAMGAPEPGTRLKIDIRGRRVEAEVASIPFYSRRR
ncbi:MAG: glycine cleavage system aminomethyltransferase GcvT [Chloroflexota bacterium]|nr:glycine cleavage system aminomethyltransferase GcvT [Chloroflexota bacterium]MDE2941832.1 glycine cleavage system aminomethyltransferase GcvT [Chloroflexota bacterium]MDE3266857.1 glycine cleavage system aminomethyltransferase GcvT [Chloroflexota bacterium]